MLTQKYDELERSYVCLREESKAGVTAYLDNDIRDRLDEISRGIKKRDAMLFPHHQVFFQGLIIPPGVFH